MKRSQQLAISPEAWTNADGFPDDIWRQLLQLYVPETPCDWIRLVATSKRLAMLCHDALLRWMHSHTRPMQWGEFMAGLPADGLSGHRLAALFSGHKMTDYAHDPRFVLRSALARFVGVQQTLNDVLIHLNILTQEGRHYDALALARLLSPWLAALSSGHSSGHPSVSRQRPLFAPFWAAFKEHFLVRIDTCSSQSL